MGENINRQNARQGEDAEFVTAFKAGDKSAFDKLVIKYQNRVFNLCYRFLGHYEESSDAAQEVFVKVYRSIGGFKFKSTFSTWLYRITVNTCKNKIASLEYRKSKRMVRLDEPKETESGTYYKEISDESMAPDAEAQNREKRVKIQNAIDSLPREQRTVVVLRDIERLPYEKIVQITGFNLGTVKSKLSRARFSLRERLGGMI